MNSGIQEVKLGRTPAERDRVDNMAELYAVINTMECLEKAFIRNCVSDKDGATERNASLGTGTSVNGVLAASRTRLFDAGRCKQCVERGRVGGVRVGARVQWCRGECRPVHDLDRLVTAVVDLGATIAAFAANTVDGYARPGSD
ncbi:unnamed protein product [Sphagnum balticum]